MDLGDTLAKLSILSISMELNEARCWWNLRGVLREYEFTRWTFGELETAKSLWLDWHAIVSRQHQLYLADDPTHSRLSMFADGFVGTGYAIRRILQIQDPHFDECLSALMTSPNTYLAAQSVRESEYAADPLADCFRDALVKLARSDERIPADYPNSLRSFACLTLALKWRDTLTSPVFNNVRHECAEMLFRFARGWSEEPENERSRERHERYLEVSNWLIWAPQPDNSSVAAFDV